MSTANTLVEEDGFGFVERPDNAVSKRRCYDVVRRYTMTNQGNSSVRLISWGAGIQSVRIPNNKGIIGDVVLGFDSVDGYLENKYEFSKVIGGLANRVSADGDEGSNGSDRRLLRLENRNWDSCILGKQVVMSNLRSTSCGDVLTNVKFAWTEEDQLHVNIRATSTAPTPVDLATRCLFNLGGHGAGPNELRNHIVTVNAGKWTFMDLRDRITTGAIRPVDSTIYDLRLPTRLTAERLRQVPGGGYDHNLCVDAPSCWCYRFHARMLHPGSGRFMEIYSNQPGIQFYTGNDLPEPGRRRQPSLAEECCFGGCGDRSNSKEKLPQGENFEAGIPSREIRGKGGVLYRRHGGFMLSPQNYPNSVNIETFPACILSPGKTYVNDITYKFGVLRKI